MPKVGTAKTVPAVLLDPALSWLIFSLNHYFVEFASYGCYL